MLKMKLQEKKKEAFIKKNQMKNKKEKKKAL
jgi:hypothetical protein